MRYTLRQLEVFLAVARFASVSRAAKALFMSQSATSGALADLERQFSVQLFDRVGKRLALNELGQALRPQAEATLEQAQELERALQTRNPVGRLRLGATLTIGNYVAAPLMARFLADHPNAQLSLAVANTEQIARQVANFEIDVGMIEGELQHPDLDVEPWRQDQLVVFCAPDHPLGRRRNLTDADLAANAWVVREHGSGTRQAFDRAMHGLTLQIALELQHTEAIKSAVASGMGLGCLSELALQQEFRSGTLKACKVPQRDFRRRFYFVLHKHKHRGTGAQAWLQLCRQPAL
ncbi:MAG: LysR family transcriptional regulator [Deltaproteobacteria bacterium]|nr:LysR family transcriptional regulator [Deltaproteobacteria bacterium]